MIVLLLLTCVDESSVAPLVGRHHRQQLIQFTSATTYGGGMYGAGTAYKLVPAQLRYVKTTIYNFSSSGEYGPAAGLLLGADGVLYGTATEDSVFVLTPAASGYAARILHAFTGAPDGSIPEAPVIVDASGSLYGTTYEGGSATRCKIRFGCGAVYKLTPGTSSYSETVIATFEHGDGAYPLAGLLSGRNGVLYGTTNGGGLQCPGTDPKYGCGSVFMLAPGGSGYIETVFHKFAGGIDGAQPYSQLIADKSGLLYGTTIAGGNASACQGGCGTIFKLSP